MSDINFFFGNKISNEKNFFILSKRDKPCLERFIVLIPNHIIDFQ